MPPTLAANARVALYTRVSTTEQTSEPQLHALREYASGRSLRIVREYVDDGVSGTRDSRPQLDAMLKACKRREVDAVAVTKLDRLARSMRHLTNLAAELDALGVELIVVEQGIDTSTPTGRLLFNLLGSIAEFERELIRERTVAGLRAAMRRGSKLGRPAALDADRLARARRLRASGQSIREIAKTLGVSKSAVARACPENVPVKEAGKGS